MEFICHEAPGICSQEDFDHDWDLLIRKIKEGPKGKHDLDNVSYFLVKLAVDKGYKINW